MQKLEKVNMQHQQSLLSCRQVWFKTGLSERISYRCRQTPVFGPRQHCVPAGGRAPCTGCRAPPAAAAAASLTARPGGNRSRGCWSEDDCMARNTSMPSNQKERTEKQPTCPAFPSGSNYANLLIKIVNKKSVFQIFHRKSES